MTNPCLLAVFCQQQQVSAGIGRRTLTMSRPVLCSSRSRCYKSSTSGSPASFHVQFPLTGIFRTKSDIAPVNKGAAVVTTAWRSFQPSRSSARGQSFRSQLSPRSDRARYRPSAMPPQSAVRKMQRAENDAVRALTASLCQSAPANMATGTWPCRAAGTSGSPRGRGSSRTR